MERISSDRISSALPMSSLVLHRLYLGATYETTLLRVIISDGNNVGVVQT